MKSENNILYDSRENFSAECVHGASSCEPAGEVRKLSHSATSVVDVYVAKIPKDSPIGSLIPKEREQEIAGVSNERVKREKYFVWKLLEYALRRSFGLNMEELTFSKTESGKWISPSCEFSLSHSDGAVAVAVSNSPIGVDIELLSSPRSVRFAERILTEREAAELSLISNEERDGYLIKAWTAKEAAFKRSSAHVFEPSGIDPLLSGVKSFSVELDGKGYILSVSSENPEKIKLYDNARLI